MDRTSRPLRTFPDEHLYGHHPALVHRDTYEVIDGLFSSRDPLQRCRSGEWFIRIVVGDVALGLQFDECVGESPDGLGEELLVLLEVTFSVAVFESTIYPGPSVPGSRTVESANQAVGIAACESMKQLRSRQY